jgi:hypothetical protein
MNKKKNFDDTTGKEGEKAACMVSFLSFPHVRNDSSAFADCNKTRRLYIMENPVLRLIVYLCS